MRISLLILFCYFSLPAVATPVILDDPIKFVLSSGETVFSGPGLICSAETGTICNTPEIIQGKLFPKIIIASLAATTIAALIWQHRDTSSSVSIGSTGTSTVNLPTAETPEWPLFPLLLGLAGLARKLRKAQRKQDCFA